MGVVMWQFYSRVWRIWVLVCHVAVFGQEARILGLLCRSFRPGCGDMGVVTCQFWGGRLRIVMSQF